MGVLSNIEPYGVFHFFEEICGIPHGSSDTKKISDYLVKFAIDKNLRYIQDESNNVIIFKDGTAGYEDSALSCYRDIWIWSVRKMLTVILILSGTD